MAAERPGEGDPAEFVQRTAVLWIKREARFR
jgi:hypothetical protein